MEKQPRPTATKEEPRMVPNDAEYWNVSMVPAEGMGLSPFMDLPRIFKCLRHEAETLFKKHYGISSTQHNIVVVKATAEEFAVQEAADKSGKIQKIPRQVA